RAGRAGRVAAAAGAGLALRVRRLTELDRLRLSLGPRQTLARGYAIVRGDGAVVTGRAAAAAARVVEVEFHDGRLVVGGGTAPRPGRRGGPEAGPEGGQGSLF
ncbi:MAG TPA: exodeoxyribonuclease VII large subunit, partial [Paracoccaceae bacterium]|nr:exodeoxyribonuclease VII large subunit [Paracoccaceae bacterium]